MQVSKINFQQAYNTTKENLRALGENTANVLRTANKNFDTYVSSKNLNPKTVKQIGLGAIVGIAGITLAASCIKGIANSIKEKIEEK